MSEDLPDRLMSPDGKWGWFAYAPDGDAGPALPWEGPPEGAIIRLMWDFGATIPLWWDGLLFNDAEDVEREWGISRDLARDLEQWGTDWESTPAAERDVRAADLVGRLVAETDGRFGFVYRP